jgi:maltose alpha-D-glucosyltransferase/alpha-amylase
MMRNNDTGLWYKNAVFYEIHVRSFCDSNGDGVGDLRGVVSKLDYLTDLGVDCLWLLPIFVSPLKDDGYDVADFYGINPDYGTIDDFSLLITEAHKRGLRVITDLVLNHTSNLHPWFVEARKSTDNEYRNYYVWSDSDRCFDHARIIFIDRELSNWTFDPATHQYYWHRFYSTQPDLNYENPAVVEAMIDVIRYWMSMGIDGFRLDAVPYLFEAEETTCENLPATHDFLKKVRSVVSEEFPHAVLLGEANQWPWDLRPYFGGDLLDAEVPGDELQMAFHFPLMPRVFKALALRNKRDIERIMRATPAIPHDCQWCLFLRNHDELSLEMVTPRDRELMWRIYAPERRMKQNLGIRRRLAPLLDNDTDRILLANRILFSLPGSPIIYYGDEIGMGDDVEQPDRNGVRTPMQWTSTTSAGFSSADPDRFWPRLITDEHFGPQRVNVADQTTDPASLLVAMKSLIRIRKANPVLGTGDCEFVSTGAREVMAYLRRDGQTVVLVLANLARSARVAHVAAAPYLGRTPVDLLTGDAFPQIRRRRYTIKLAANQCFWLRL